MTDQIKTPQHAQHEARSHYGRSRSTNYKTYLKTIRNRLTYLDGKEAEWQQQHPGEKRISYFRTEQFTLRWVLELIQVFMPEERRSPEAPIPVITDECPKCRAVTKRLNDGMRRANPWICSECGHQYESPVP